MIHDQRSGPDQITPRHLGALEILGALLLLTGGPTVSPAGEAVSRVAIDDPSLALAPYVWKCHGTGPAARAEAAMPGAYFRVRFRGSSTVGLLVDGTANDGCPPPSMPVVEYSVDDGPFATLPLTRTGELYSLPLAAGLDPAAPHRLDVYFRAADLGQNRWTASTAPRDAPCAATRWRMIQCPPCFRQKSPADGFAPA